MKIAITIPSTGTIKSQTVFSLCRMLKDFPHDYTVLFHEGSMLHVMRERLVERAISEKCTHLLFVDSDVVFEKDAVVRLLGRNKEIVGAPVNRRKLNAGNNVVNPKKEKGLTTCEAIGTGFLLIDLSVLKDLKQPWFFWGMDGTGEDYWFCRLAREAGYKIWVDYQVKVGHIGDTIF